MGNSEDLAALVANLIRVGEVTSINPEAFTARVRFIDRENTESYDMQVLARGSLRDKNYHMPDIGENVLCLFLPTGVEAGFVIGAYYPSDVGRPASTEDVTCTLFGDGTRIQYDRAANNLLVDASASGGTVTVICSTATVQASDSVMLDTPETTCTGNLTVGGSASINNSLSVGAGGGSASVQGGLDIVGGSLTHNGKDVGSTHRHTGVISGGDTSGEPV